MITTLVVIPLLAQPNRAPNLNGADASAVDHTCKPCDDFYQFAMGAWHSKYPIPPKESTWGKGRAAMEHNDSVLKHISEEEAVKGGLVGDFYGSCMDTASMDTAGIKPIEPELESIREIVTPDQVGAEITRMFESGLPAPVEISSSPHTADPRRVVAVVVFPAMLGLPGPEYYTREDARAKATIERYQEFMRASFRMGGYPEAQVMPVLELESRLARTMRTNAQRRDPQGVRYLSPVELHALVPEFDWQEHFAAVKAPFTGEIMISESALLREFGRQLRETPVQVWKDYLAWTVLHFAADHLSEPFRRAHFSFYREYLSGQEAQPRWQECVQATDSSLGDALGKLYVERTFRSAIKRRMIGMFENVRAALAETIRLVDWMTPATKEQALKKLATLQPRIGYPDRWHTYYGEAMQRSSFAANQQRAARYDKLETARQIGKPADPDRWFMTASTFNAYYYSPLNIIVIPAGRLVPPMFSLDADDAPNYGAIGAVMGHEIGHGFDDAGSQYDSEGRLRNWWTPDDRKRFLERAQCVADQFDGYFVEEGLHHNGKFVLGESIGDLSGLRVAFAAYQKSLQGKPHPKVRDGFTAEQRFFLAYAQFRGNAEAIEQQRRMILTDSHPTARFRVNGPLSNMAEFRAAFGWQLGDPMVRPPEKQCRIW